MGAASTIPCPACSADISWRRAPREFQCETCGRWLLARPSTGERISGVIVALLMMTGASAAPGLLHDLSIAGFTALVIVHYAALFNMRLFRPQITVRDGMVDVVPHPPTPVGSTMTFGAPPIDDPPDTGRPARRLFQLKDPPRSLEGVVIGVVGVVFVAWHGYRAVEPLLYRVYPEFRATRTGPEGFPIHVHIGSDALQVTNGSGLAWECALRVGQRGVVYSPWTTVPAGETRDVTFVQFRDGTTHPDPAALAQLARQVINAECVDQDGRMHRARLPTRFY